MFCCTSNVILHKAVHAYQSIVLVSDNDGDDHIVYSGRSVPGGRPACIGLMSWRSRELNLKARHVGVDTSRGWKECS